MCKGMNMLTTVTRERLIKSYVIFIYVIKRIRKSSTSPKKWTVRFFVYCRGNVYVNGN